MMKQKRDVRDDDPPVEAGMDCYALFYLFVKIRRNKEY